MDKTLAGLQHQESEIAEENWSSLEATIYDTALSVLGKSNSKHQDWFNDTDKKLLQEWNTARVKKLQVNTRSNRTKLTGTRRSLKQYTREMKSQRWEAKEAEKKDTKELLKWSDRGKWDIEEGYNTAYWPWWWDSNAGESWDYFGKLLNITGEVDRSVLDTTALRPNIASLNEKPEVKELLDAITATNTGKAPGMGGIPAELWKHGGVKLTSSLYKLVLHIWETE